MASGTVNLRYRGPQSRVVALDLSVEDGDVFECPKDEAPRLLGAAGFEETKSKPQSAEADRQAKAEAEATKADSSDSSEDGGE